MDCLDPIQSKFRPGYGAEMALVALVNDMHKEMDRGSMALLILLELLAAFESIGQNIHLDVD